MKTEKRYEIESRDTSRFYFLRHIHIQWGFLTQSFTAGSGVGVSAAFPLNFTSHLFGVAALHGDGAYINGTVVGILFQYGVWNTERFTGSFNVTTSTTSNANATYIAIGS